MMRTRRPASLALLATASVVVAAAFLGCEPKPVPPPDTTTPIVTEPFERTWDRVMAAQANRRRGLEKLVASGPVELRWNDADGDHFENCRGELFLRLPDDTALSLTKVGERFLWIGSAESQRWLFDMRTADVTLWIVEAGAVFDQQGGFVAPVAQRRAAGAPIPISQLSLIDLLGLMEFPPFGDLDAVRDDVAGAPRVEFMGQGGPVRVTIDQATALPRDVEVMADDGSVLVRTVFEAYESFERQGLPPGGLPKWPTRVIVTAPRPGDGRPGDEIKLFMTPSPSGEGRIVDRLFDLEALKAMFKPAKTSTPRQDAGR